MMLETPTTTQTAALLYQDHDPLNFKHLATTLNLILEPANLKFRVIHERPSEAAILSCRKLHVSIVANDAGFTAKNSKTNATPIGPDLTEMLQSKIAGHRRTIEISVGSGPVPHGPAHEDRSSDSLLPILAQMVVNHLLNLNPADAIYWGATDQMMSPRAFLAMINAPIANEQQDGPDDLDGNQPINHERPHANIEPPQNEIRRDVATAPENPMDGLDPNLTQFNPSFIFPNLAQEQDEPDQDLSAQFRERFSNAITGPKAPFIVSLATILIAPVAGVLLLIYNFLGGARLRQTALLACIAAASVIATDIFINKPNAATAAMPIENVETVKL